MGKQFAITFPGQGSQSVGMLSDLAAVYPVVRQTFEEASEAVGFDLWSVSQNGPKDVLNDTRNTQPALLCAGMSVMRVLQDRLPGPPIVMAGHSLGEYTALTAAGVLTLADAARLVALRGRFMQEAVPVGTGAMAAILGLDTETLDKVCRTAAQGQVVSPANFNSAGQVVIAGHAEAVDRAMELAKENGAKRALPLPVSAPFHCALMQPAAEAMAAYTGSPWFPGGMHTFTAPAGDTLIFELLI